MNKLNKYLSWTIKYVDKYYGRTQNNLISHLVYYRVITIKYSDKKTNKSI